jgi:hypothetical protein
MIRALTILVAVAALAVSAAPAPAASGSPAGFSLSLDGINCGFYAEMDSGLTPSAVVFKHGQGTAAFLSWAQSGTHKNATLELHAADGTTVARYYLENAWVAKIEISGLRAGSADVMQETVTIGYLSIGKT